MRPRRCRARLPPAPRAAGRRRSARAATALFLRAYARGERVHLAMLARGYAGTHAARSSRCGFRRADALFVGSALRRSVLRAGARGGGVIRARRAALRLSRTGDRALRGVDLHVAHGERVAVLGAQRRRQDDADAAPQRAAAAAGGTLEVAGSRSAPETAARAARPRRARLPGPRRPAVHADGPRGRGVRAAQPRRSAAREVGARVAEALGAVGMAARRRPRAAPALDGGAPPGRDRHRARHAPDAAGARRADRRTSTRARGASCSTSSRRRADAAGHHARPAVRRASCASAPSSSPAAASWRTGRGRRCSPTRACSPRTTSSCPAVRPARIDAGLSRPHW